LGLNTINLAPGLNGAKRNWAAASAEYARALPMGGCCGAALDGAARGAVLSPAEAERASRPGEDMLLLIDNYDSFTYNLVHYLGELGAETVVHRNDALTVQDAIALRPDAIVISPGPCDPDRAGISLPLVRAAAGRIPVLGVCLGHQAIAQAFGATIGRACEVMHGKLSPIEHDGSGVFADLPMPFTATRYHSLVAVRETIPSELEINARTADGTIMGLRHTAFPIHGVQFHPESIETEHGHRLLRNFLELAQVGGRA
jgi:anthranilate synthase component 2